MNHSVFRICANHKAVSRALSCAYVTIIGIFLTSGIYLDIRCTCGKKGARDCCTRENYAVALAGTPFVVALAWVFVNKLILEYFLEPSSPRLLKAPKGKAKRISKKKDGAINISRLICGIGMLVVVIAGFIATAVYSFQFPVFSFSCFPRSASVCDTLWLEISELGLDWNGRHRLRDRHVGF